jgi:predicted MPP superfamily phosphohydrolase
MVHFAPMTQAGPSRAAARRRRVAAFVARLLAFLTACWVVVAVLLAPLLPGRGWAAAGAAVVFTVLPIVVFILTRVRHRYPGSLVRRLVFRPLWYAQLFVVVLAPVGLAAALAGLPFGAAAAAGRAAVLLGGGAVAITAVIGYFGSRRLEVRRLVATLPALPGALEGLTVVQLSDLHIGPQTSRRHLARVARAVRDARPDLIAVTGDLVDDFPGDAAYYAAGLGTLRAPLGVFAIPGNHEVYSGWPELRRRLEELPLKLLVNRAVVVDGRGGSLAVVGTGDPAGGDDPDAGPDIDRALAEVPPGSFVLALAHDPALWPALAARGVPLTLSGHTHWGQLAFERLGWSLASPFLELAMGWHARGGSLLYIHPGTNYWGVPFRLGHAAQVAVVTLRRGQRAEIKGESTGESRDAELRGAARGELRGKRPAGANSMARPARCAATFRAWGTSSS